MGSRSFVCPDFDKTYEMFIKIPVPNLFFAVAEINKYGMS